MVMPAAVRSETEDTPLSSVAGQPREGTTMTSGTAAAALPPAYCFGPSSFVGRQRELREIKSLLADSRLTTLTGPGGVGKSRLAHQTVAGLRRAYHGAVAGVDMVDAYDSSLLTQEVQDPDLLAHLVATTLGVASAGAGTATETLIASLAPRPALLLLDNCERLLPACALLADTLLRTCPGLRILATSREPFRTPGEVIYPIQPLPTPDPEGRAGAGELRMNDAVALFVARAQAVSRFELTGQDAPAVAELCRRLDGLPLAIELAAVRVRALAPGQILERMNQRFGLLSRGTRTAPPRQRTLRACVDWSFELCDKPERVLWARLAVFQDGFELDAAEGVCTDESLPAEDLLDHLAGLVDKSVVISETAGDGIRYRMLETLREYGWEKLTESGRLDEIRRRHRDWYGRLVRRAAEDRFSPRQTEWFARLDRELPNLRAALAHGMADPDGANAAVEIAGSLWHLWAGRGRYDEGRAWLDRVLAHRTDPAISRLEAWYGAIVLAVAQGDLAAADAAVRQAHEVAARLSHEGARSLAACADGVLAMARGDLAEAVHAWRRATALVPGPGGPWLAEALAGLARTVAMLGDVDAAASCHERIVALAPEGELRYSGGTLASLGIALRVRGDRTAEARLRDGLHRLHRAGDVAGIAWCLEALAWTTGHPDRSERVAVLLGAAAGLIPAAAIPGPLAAHHDECRERAVAVLGEHAYRAAFARGGNLSADEAVAYALDEPRSEPPPSPEEPSPLTRREGQVAGLVAEGRSNQDIAETLVISRRTVESHVEHILAKLGLANRAQVAAWATAAR